MRIGIVGPAERAVAWERHIRPQNIVSEVAIAPSVRDIGEVDACFLLDDSSRRLERLLDSIKMGYHSFLVSRLPRDTTSVRRIYHAAEEANVRLQFSHWPTLSPLFQWMKNRVANPEFAQFIREIDHPSFMEMDLQVGDLWIDEVALALKWIDRSVHHIDARRINLGGSTTYGAHIFLQFENGTAVSVWINTTSEQTTHRRRVANSNFLLDCNVEERLVRLGRKANSDHLFFEKQTFKDTEAAASAATQFLKAIRLKKATAFNGYDALRVCKTVDKIQQKMSF